MQKKVVNKKSGESAFDEKTDQFENDFGTAAMLQTFYKFYVLKGTLTHPVYACGFDMHFEDHRYLHSSRPQSLNM